MGEALVTLAQRLVQAAIRTRTATLCAADETGLLVSISGPGIQPLLTTVEQAAGAVRPGLDWGDWMVGRAAALLLLLMRPRAIFGAFMSIEAQALLRRAGLPYACDQTIPRVLNRMGTGPCPMELAVHGLEEPAAALEALKQAVRHVQSTTVREENTP